MVKLACPPSLRSGVSRRVDAHDITSKATKKFNKNCIASVAKLVDAHDSKSCDRKVMRVRFSPEAQSQKNRCIVTVLFILTWINIFYFSNSSIFFFIS